MKHLLLAGLGVVSSVGCKAHEHARMTEPVTFELSGLK